MIKLEYVSVQLNQFVLSLYILQTSSNQFSGFSCLIFAKSASIFVRTGSNLASKSPTFAGVSSFLNNSVIIWICTLCSSYRRRTKDYLPMEMKEIGKRSSNWITSYHNHFQCSIKITNTIRNNWKAVIICGSFKYDLISG